jgi:hypothetical protein
LIKGELNMAKKIFKLPKHETGQKITTKTFFGTDSSMVVQDDDENVKGIKLEAHQVVCKDDRGYYVTTKNHVDSGLADPNRYANARSRQIEVLTEEEAVVQ